MKRQIICIEVADKLENIEFKMLELDYETDKNKFGRIKKCM